MTTEHSVLKKFAFLGFLVAPLVLGGVFALALGFTAPSAANADGMDGGYSGYIEGDDYGYDGGYSGYIDNGYDGGYSGYIDPIYDDFGYDGGYSGYIDNGYDGGYNPITADSWNPITADTWNPITADYSPGYSSYGGYSNNYYVDDCSYYGYCGGVSYASNWQPYSYSNYDYSYDYDYVEDYYYEYEHVYEYDYCTNIPGLQANGYDCYPDHDECSNIPGNQPDGYDCYPDHHDECSNIPGNQPNGYDCYPDHEDDDLSCDLTADDRTVDEGDEVTLEWDIDGDADYASINHGVGRVDEDGGEEDVEVDEDTTFRLTVRNDDDEATCSVTVRVDEDNNFSSIDFEGEPANNPPQVVYLSSIPYTGLEDIDPALLSYWLMLIAGAGMLGWFLYRNGFVPSFAFAKSEPMTEGETGTEAPVGDAPASTASAFIFALAADDADSAIDGLRTAAAEGASIEEVLEEAAKAAEGTDLETKVNAALEASRVNGIRGVKAALA